MKKISLNGLENVLSPKEMKDINGGSNYWLICCNGASFSVTADLCDDVEHLAQIHCGDCYAIIGPGCK
jgi:natural product precursor